MIKEKAEEILKLESNIQLNKDVKESEQRISSILNSLSLEEMIELDEYISEHKT